MEELSARQQRERDYYNQYAALNPIQAVTFDPVLGHELRPWNSYWAVYQFAREHFQPGHSLLDFGCGCGEASIRYAKIGYRVHGFDVGPKNIETCKSLAAQYGFAGMTSFQTSVAEHLPYPDGHFDMVAGIDILHHVEIAVAIKEVRRVLKPGGRAIFREWIEVPQFERVRNSGLVKAIYPKGMSLEGHITEDERKLNITDVANIRKEFPSAEFRRFCIFSRLRRVLPVFRPSKPSRLEQFDHFLMRQFPHMSQYGGEVVIVLQAPSQ